MLLPPAFQDHMLPNIANSKIIKQAKETIKDSDELIEHFINHPNGTRAYQWFSKSGIYHGSIKSWNEDGTILSSGTYNNGVLCGAYEIFDADGAVIFSEEY